MANRSQVPDPTNPTKPANALAARPRQLELSALYVKHRGELVRYVRRTFGMGPPDPEDVVQAAFTHYAALAHPNHVDNPRAFLYRASRNFVIDQRRRDLVRSRAVRRGDTFQLNEASDDVDAGRVLEGKERLRILQETICAMPRRLRDALILHRIEELSFVEIARRLGVSQTTAKRSVSEAVLVCARALRKADSEF